MHDRDRRGGSQIGTLPDFQVTRSSSYAQLGIGTGGTAAANTRAAIAALGGLGKKKLKKLDKELQAMAPPQ